MELSNKLSGSKNSTLSRSLQDCIEELRKGQKPLSKKYVLITDVTPPQNGLFTILQANHPDSPITFITSFPEKPEKIREYINNLSQVEVVIDGIDTQGKQTLIFNLVAIEKLILSQQKLTIDRLFEFTDIHSQLTQKIRQLNLSNLSIVKQIKKLGEILEQAEKERIELENVNKSLVQENEQLKNKLVDSQKQTIFVGIGAVFATLGLTWFYNYCKS